VSVAQIAEEVERERREALRKSVGVLAERRNWLSQRIIAKTTVGWDVEWDTRERDALSHVIDEVDLGLLVEPA
jgi:hypothetical protein